MADPDDHPDDSGDGSFRGTAGYADSQGCLPHVCLYAACLQSGTELCRLHVAHYAFKGQQPSTYTSPITFLLEAYHNRHTCIRWEEPRGSVVEYIFASTYSHSRTGYPAANVFLRDWSLVVIMKIMAVLSMKIQRCLVLSLSVNLST